MTNEKECNMRHEYLENRMNKIGEAIEHNKKTAAGANMALIEDFIKPMKQDLKEIKKEVESDFVRRIWFFWAFGGITALLVATMTMFYSKLENTENNMNDIKVSIATIEATLKYRQIITEK